MTSNRWKPPQLYYTLYSIAWHCLVSVYPIKLLFGWYAQKVYNPLKYKLQRKLMADFIEQDWNGYKIKLWPSDPFRKQIAMQRLEAAVLYFNTTNIRFDMRISRINDKKVAEDTITYEWWLCKHNKPIKDPQDGTFFFINPTGCGTFQFSTAKKRIYKNTDMIPIKYGNFVGNRKLVAIDIGRIGELDHYTVVMKFNTTSGAPSPPFEMAGFTVFDRDIFTRYYILSALAIVTVTIISIILKACGISS